MTDAELAELFQTQRNEEAAARADAEAERDALRLRLAEVERMLLATEESSSHQYTRAERALSERDDARRVAKRLARDLDMPIHYRGIDISTALAYEVEP